MDWKRIGAAPCYHGYLILTHDKVEFRETGELNRMAFRRFLIDAGWASFVVGGGGG